MPSTDYEVYYLSKNKDVLNAIILASDFETAGIYLDKYLQKGKKNNPDAVAKLQKFLNDFLNAGIKVDGIFGAKTDKFVRQFQSSHGDKILTPWGLKGPTGIVYLTTVTEINNIMCPALNLPIPTLVPTISNPDFPKL